MNEKTRTYLFAIAGFLLLTGLFLYIFHSVVAPYMFAVGAAGIAVAYLTVPTKEMDFRLRRLHRYNVLSSLLCVFASALMFSQRKEWIICVTIFALIQLYTSFVKVPKKK